MLGTTGSPLGVEAIMPSPAPADDCISSILSPALHSMIPWQTSTAVKPPSMDCSVFELSTSVPFCRIHSRTVLLPPPALVPTWPAAMTK